MVLVPPHSDYLFLSSSEGIRRVRVLRVLDIKQSNRNRNRIRNRNRKRNRNVFQGGHG